MEVSKSAMNLLMDDDFIDKRIREQKEYLVELKSRFAYSRDDKWYRYVDLRESAQERLDFFESLKKYKLNNKA